MSIEGLQNKHDNFNNHTISVQLTIKTTTISTIEDKDYTDGGIHGRAFRAQTEHRDYHNNNRLRNNKKN